MMWSGVCPHHQDVGVVGRDQHNAKVLADLLDALEQDLKKFLIGDKLEEDFGEGGREGGKEIAYLRVRE